MKRYNDTNTTVAVAIVVIVVMVGGVVSAQAATVAYWRFEGNEAMAVADGTPVPIIGTPMRDEVGGSHLVGNAAGPSWQGDDAGDLFGAAVPNPDPLDTDSNGTLNANGVNTRSLRLDTTPHYVKTPDNDMLDFSGPFTVEGFFRIDSEPAPTKSELFVYKRDNAAGGLGYQVWMDHYGRVGFLVDNGPTVARVGWDDIDNNHNANLLDDGQWHHFAGIRDDFNDLHIYIDGVEDTEPWTNGITNLGGDLSNNFGLRIGSAGLNGMTGYLDEIRLSNVALTPDQFLNASVSLPPILRGDYNGNGVVDAADYSIWQDNLGLDAAVLGGLGSGAETVVQTDYDLWKTNFGQSADSSSEAGSVPEPTTLLLALLALAAVLLRAPRG